MIKKIDRDLHILGTRIKGIRQEQGLSQEALAFEAGLDRSYVGGIERGERNITFRSLALIAKALNTDIGTLTSGLPERRK
jgi:transcriptional regulator with XRE-family HTH domain